MIYLIATAQIKEGPKHTFIVPLNERSSWPKMNQIKEEDRSVDEIVQSAEAKGFEIRFCAFNESYSKSAMELQEELYKRLAKKYADVRSMCDIELELHNRIYVR